MRIFRILQFFTYLLLFLVFSTSSVEAKTLVVGSDGYPTISQAVQAAQNGDIISIHAGTYKEKIDINKQLTLTSFGDGQVWIDRECNFPYGIQVTGSGTIIKNLGVKKTTDQGILIRKATSNITIDGNTIQDFNCKEQGKQASAGIYSWYGGSGIKIIKNKITYRVEIAGNQRGHGNGIHFKSNDQNPSGGGHLISGNIITGGYDGIGGGEEGSNRGSFDKDTIIENNTIKNCWDDGIQVEGGNVNIRVRNNRIETCGSGIAFAPNKIGPLYIENNTIFGDVNAKGFHGSVSCFKVGRKGSGTAYVTSNSCSIPGGSSNGGNGFGQSNNGLSPIVSRKNTILVSRYIMEINGVTADSSFDEDCMYTSDTGRFIEFGNKKFKDLKSFQDATGQEKNGTQSQNCPGIIPVPKKIETPKPTIKPTTPTITPTPLSTPIPPASIPAPVKKSYPQENQEGLFLRFFTSLYYFFKGLFNN